LRVLAVDQQRTGDADRHLRHARELLDVARQHGRVERVARLSESRETVFRHASGGGLRSAIGSRKLDSFVQVPIAKRS